jgi:hypothetical protein
MKRFGVVYSTDFHQHYEDCLSLKEAEEEAKELEENNFRYDVWIFEKIQYHDHSGDNYGIIWYSDFHTYYDGGYWSYEKAEEELEEALEYEDDFGSIVRRVT